MSRSRTAPRILYLLALTIMFLTRDSMELPGSLFVYGPQTRQWRAMALSGPHAWFLATFEARGDFPHGDSLCLSWDQDVVQCIEAPPVRPLKALLCLWPDEAGTTRWRSRHVQRIYRGAVGQQERFVFFDTAGIPFCADLERTDPQHVTDLTLVADLLPMTD